MFVDFKEWASPPYAFFVDFKVWATLAFFVDFKEWATPPYAFFVNDSIHARNNSWLHKVNILLGFPVTL